MPSEKFQDDQIEEMLRRMADGEALTAIAADARMPSVDSMNRWEDAGDDFAASITRARARGVHIRAERAVETAKKATDAGLGRLAFDADRWYVSKLNPRKYGDKLDVTSDGKAISLSAEVEAARKRAEGAGND